MIFFCAMRLQVTVLAEPTIKYIFCYSSLAHVHVHTHLLRLH